MFYGFLNNLFQVLITGNKTEQKNQLRELLMQLDGDLKNKTILDFGCGTGLFSGVFVECGLNYFGYDIDASAIKYAVKARASAQVAFLNSFKKIEDNGPYDLVFANCCFHHIEDDLLLRELEKIGRILKEHGIFIMKDLLLDDAPVNFFCRAFRKFERGAYKRGEAAYRSLIEQKFCVFQRAIQRTHVFSIRGLPIYNDTIVLTCRKKMGHENKS